MMDEFEFIDANLQQILPESRHLSVQLSPSSFSFAVQETEGNRLTYLKHIPFEPESSRAELGSKLQKMVASMDKLAGEFKSVAAIWTTNKYTLVPTEYFDIVHIRKYFELAHPLEDLDELQACSLTGNNYHLIFAIPQEIVHELSNSWPGLSFSHQLIPFGHVCVQDQSNNTHTAVYVQAYSSFTDIMVFQEGRMKLANAYMIQEKNDLIYHLLNTYRHFGLNAAYDELIFADRYIRGLQRPESLKKYFKNVRFFKPGISDANLSLFQAQDISRYVNLLNLRSCEL